MPIIEENMDYDSIESLKQVKLKNMHVECDCVCLCVHTCMYCNPLPGLHWAPYLCQLA